MFKIWLFWHNIQHTSTILHEFCFILDHQENSLPDSKKNKGNRADYMRVLKQNKHHSNGGGGGQRPVLSRFVRRSGIFLNGAFFGAGQNGTNRDILTIKNLNIKNIVSFYHHCTTSLSSEQFSYQGGGGGWQGDVWLSLANYTQGFQN